MMRSKVWLVVLSICGLGLAACDKEETPAPEASAVSTNSNTGGSDNNGGSSNNGSVGQANDEQSGRGGPEDGRINGAFIVSSAMLNDADVTADFAGVKFQFTESGSVLIQGGSVNLKGSYRVDERVLRLFVDGQAGDHNELMQSQWGLNEFEVSTMTIVTPYMNGPRYIIMLERTDG